MRDFWLTAEFRVTFAILTVMVVAQGCFAWRDGLLTVKQMLGRGIREGLPISMHGGMWGDLIWFSALVAAIVAIYGREWSWTSVGLAILVGLAGSFGMHELYKNIPWPETHVQGHSLTEAGWVHFLYMVVAFSVLLLYYVTAPYTAYMWLVSAGIIVHVAIGNHVLLGFARPFWYPGHPLQNTGTWATIGGVAALTLGCTAFRMLFFR